MSWTRAAIYWAGFLALFAYWAMSLRESPTPAAHVTRVAFLDVAEEQIVAVDVRRGDIEIRCRLVQGRWQVVEPAGRSVPPDLVAALVANLTQMPDVEVVAERATNLAQFGLDHPTSQLVLGRKDGTAISVRLGTRNPAGTAVYAQREDGPRVYLIGLNVRYYEDLLFEALRPAT